MPYNLYAVVRFPDNILGPHPIEELILDTIQGGWTISYRLRQQDSVVSSITASPEVMIQQHKLAEQQRLVKVKCVVDEDDDRQAWIRGTKEIETLCSWLSFLCLKPFQITSWDAALGGSGSKIVSSKMPNVPDDYNALIRVSSYTPPMNYNLSAWLLDAVPSKLSPIIRWFRKGMLAMHLEEKMIFWVTAMEGVSEALEIQKHNAVTCPECGHSFIPAPATSKTGLLDFVRNVLGYSRNKIYEPIWQLRSKYVHAAFDAQERYSKDELEMFENATRSLAIASISYLILTRLSVPFYNKEQILNDGYKNSHPALGQLPWIQDHLDRLAVSKHG